MANTVKMKRSATPSKVPTTTDLDLGEIGINTYDGKMYIKKDDGTASIVQVGAGGSGSGNVVGPASATDNAVVRFDGTTGELIQNSNATLSDAGTLNVLNINTDYVQLDTVATPPTIVEGTLAWNDGDGTADLGLKGGNVVYQLGEQEFCRVYNQQGATISKGQVVYISGAQGNRVAVQLAQANSEIGSRATIGIVAETIAAGAEGWVQVSGKLPKLNTTGLTEGSPLYLSPTTAGAYTQTRPTAPDNTVILGWVERVNATVGSIYIKVDNGYELDELHNVLINTATNGDTLIYNSTVGVWENSTLTAGNGIGIINGAGSITIENTGIQSLNVTSPVASTGTANPTLSLSSGYGDLQNPYGSKSAANFLASPVSESGVPTFRAINATDIPTLNQNTTGTASNVTGTVAIVNGGTGETTRQAAINTLVNATTAGYYLKGDGTNVAMAAIQAADVPTLNQNTTGTAANITATSNSTLTTLSALALPYTQLSGTVPTWNQNTTGTADNVTGVVAISNGGTGQTTQQAALNAIAGTQSSGTYLRSDGTNTSLSTIQASDVPTLNQNTTGTASNITATSNSTLTTLSSLALPYSQLSGTVPTWNQNTTGTADNVTGVVAVANGGTNANNATDARTNLSAAKSGANTDITSVALTSGTITTEPTSSNDIVNKSYADSIAAGVNFHAACNYATTAALSSNTYNNGTSGVGATITSNTNGALFIDGYSPTVGQRILVKNESTQANNGVYTVTQVGNGSTPYILTRATDFNTAGSGVNQIDAGDLFLVIAGTTNANTSWVQQTPLPITVGTTAIVFIEFAATQTYTAGTGLSLVTNQFSIADTGTAGTYGSASSVPVFVTNAQGQVTSVTNTAIAIAGSAVSGNISGNAANVTGTVAVANGGTGQTTYTDGQLLIGNSTGNTLTKATLTQGSGISITNGNGSITISASGGSGVSSVTGTSPVVSSGGTTPAISLASGYGDTQNPYASKSANFILAAPNGSAGVPTFRAIVAADIPTLNQNTTGSAATATTATNLAGGTIGRIPYQSAADTTAYINPNTTTTQRFLRQVGDGTNPFAPSWSLLTASDIPTLNQNTTGTAANVTGIVAVANGGTGQSSAGSAALESITGATIITASGGTTTLTNASTYYQIISGASAHTIQMPVNSTLDVGWAFAISNLTAFTITINSSAGAALYSILPTTTMILTCTSTAAATGWVSAISTTSTGQIQLGSFGVGTAPSGTAGEIRATNNVTAYYTSDKKFKENIRAIPSALPKVLQIGGKLFDWTDEYIAEHGGEDGYFVRKSDFGVIAQDVQEVFDVAVRTKEDGTLAVDYEKMCALAFAAIKELNQRIVELELKVK